MSGAGAPAGGVLVTGATGFFGSRLVEILRGRGARVRALVRPTGYARRLEALGVEIARGDVTDPASLAAAAAGPARRSSTPRARSPTGGRGGTSSG